MAHEVKPFRIAAPETVEMSPWIRPDLDDSLLPEYLEGWDPESPVVVERTIRCDVDRLRQEIGVREDVQFVLTVSWTNQQSAMVERGFRAQLVDEQVARVTMPGDRLGGSVAIRTTVAIESSDPERRLGSPRWAGSVVAEHAQRLVLEGEGAMFPVSTVDFTHTAYGSSGSWALEMGQTLEAPLLGALLLLVNTGDSELTEALVTTKRSARQDSLLDQLEGDVAALLVSTAKDLEDELKSQDWPQDSLGDVLTTFLDASAVGQYRGGVGFERAAENARLLSAVRNAGFGRQFE